MSLKTIRIIGVVTVGILMFTGSARAESKPEINTYVSDEFKRVARQAFKDVVASQIKKSCPKGKPLCDQVVDRLSDAFDAAMSKDEAGLRLALNGFFLDASVNALLEATTGEILSESTTESFAEAMTPAMRCLSKALSGQREARACALTQKEREDLSKAIKDLAAEGSTDKATRDRIADGLAKGKGLKPKDVVEILVLVASMPEVSRSDLRIYLLHLNEALAENTSQGLFEPLLAFLSKDRESRSLNAIVEQDLESHILLAGAKDDEESKKLEDAVEKALVACKQDPEPFKTWKETRSASFVSQLREQLLLGKSLDLDIVRRLFKYRSCPADSTGAIKQFKNNLGFLFAPLLAHDTLMRYAVPGLSAAAILDYVRTSDEVQLERNAERVLLFGVAQVAVRNSAAKKLEAERANAANRVELKNLLSMSKALGSCEIQTAAALFGVSMPGKRDDGKCITLVTEAEITAPAVPTNTGGVQGPQWFKNNRDAILKALVPTLELAAKRAQDLQFFEGIDSSALLMAVQQLGNGEINGAEQTLVRFGVDLLAAKTEEYAARLVGTQGEKCLEDSRSTVLFSRVGAACAAQLLIQSAYQPIADYYWQYGIKGDDVQPLARTVYREMLASPLLDHTPIILNVGLGSNYIIGKEAVWGSGGTLTLTLVDKVGLAFYKHSSRDTVFETGLFAGGFLDALVRTAINEGEDQRYWLLGWTAGWPRLGGMDLGIEAHVAAAMPFKLSAREQYGLVGGITVVIPFNTVLTDEE